MFYFEDHDLEEQSRAAGIEAFSANLGDKSAPHIIQRFVNIYDHLASTLFNKDMLQKLYPEQAGKKFSIQELTYAQRSFKNHVERYGYMNMAACPVPSVVGLKTSILDYSIALSNYTDFGIRVEKTLSTLYKLLAEIMNADDALKSLSTVSRLTTIDTQPKYRARYNAEMQKHIGESKPTTEVPYGKLVRSNKEMLQTFDHRNGFEKALDEKTKDQIENHVTKIAYLMNSVADQIANDDSETNGRVVSALSNTLFEVGQMTRDYGTYLFRINALIGVVDGVVAECTNYTPAHVKRAVDEAVAAGNNGLEIAEFDAGLNAFNMSAVGKLLTGVIIALIGGIGALIAFGKKSGGESKASEAKEIVNEIKATLAEKPEQAVQQGAAKAPEVVKTATEIVKAGGVAKASTKIVESASPQSTEVAKLLGRIEEDWNHHHYIEHNPSAPKFNAEKWLRNPQMPYAVRSPHMDQLMSSSMLYHDGVALGKRVENKFTALAEEFHQQVRNYKTGYENFLKEVSTNKPIMEGRGFVSSYISENKGSAEGDALMNELKKMFMTKSEGGKDQIPAEIQARLDKYTKGSPNFMNADVLNESLDIAFKGRQKVMSAVESSQADMNATLALCRRSLTDIEQATRDNAGLAKSYAPHIKQLRAAGVELGKMSSSLYGYYSRTTAEESVVIGVLMNFRTFARNMKKLGELLNK